MENNDTKTAVNSALNQVSGKVITAVIFDLGNVLLDFDHRRSAQRLSGFTDKTDKEIYELFFDSGLTGLFEEGKISPLEFFSKVKGMLNARLDYQDFVPIWNEIFFFSEKNLAVYNLARKLKNRYITTLLSNINILHLQYIKKAFPIFDAFHNVLASCELGFRKPQIQIYQLALEIIDVAGPSIFYTDDRPELIAGAQALGIKGFVFEGVEKLKRDLLDSGININ